MKLNLKILSNNNRDLKTSLVLESEKVFYTFNLPDGFLKTSQSLGHSEKKTVNNCSYIFLSSLSADSIGGLLGLFQNKRN